MSQAVKWGDTADRSNAHKTPGRWKRQSRRLSDLVESRWEIAEDSRGWEMNNFHGIAGVCRAHRQHLWCRVELQLRNFRGQIGNHFRRLRSFLWENVVVVVNVDESLSTAGGDEFSILADGQRSSVDTTVIYKAMLNSLRAEIENRHFVVVAVREKLLGVHGKVDWRALMFLLQCG